MKRMLALTICCLLLLSGCHRVDQEQWKTNDGLSIQTNFKQEEVDVSAEKTPEKDGPIIAEENSEEFSFNISGEGTEPSDENVPATEDPSIPVSEGDGLSQDNLDFQQKTSALEKLNMLYQCKDQPINDYETTSSICINAVEAEINEAIYKNALNIERLTADHPEELPLCRIDTLEELNRFKDKLDSKESNDPPSFHKATAHYNEGFFQEYSLILVYLEAPSCSYRYRVHCVHNDGVRFKVHIMLTNAEEFAAGALELYAKEDCFFTVAVPKKELDTCTSFEACKLSKERDLINAHYAVIQRTGSAVNQTTY